MTIRKSLPVLNLGFRLFFLGATFYSIAVVGIWLLVYATGLPYSPLGMTVFQWHAHEMIFGYATAVVAGFLLTAVKTWTGIQTLHGSKLAFLFLIWLAARVLFTAGGEAMAAAAALDLLFLFLLIPAVVHPIIKTRNWRQTGVISKLMLLALLNALFYAGFFGLVEQGMHYGIYGGLFLLVGLILTMGGRVIPFFIERGVGYPVQFSRSLWLTIAGMILFVVFFVSELFLRSPLLTGISSAGLCLVYGARLVSWHSHGIWRRPLLWSLYLAYLFIVLGFLLFTASAFTGIPRYLPVHALAYGGVGLMTLSMMTRVSLGHTGRNIHDVPRLTVYAFWLLTIGVMARVLLPLVAMDGYRLWIIVSQGLWIAAFALFAVKFAPILMRARIDGKPE